MKIHMLLQFNNRALHDLFHGASVRPSSSNHMVNGCAARSLSKFTCSRSAARTVWSTRSPFLNVSSMKLAAQRHPFSSSASNEAFEARLEAINKKFNKRMKYLMWCCGFISFSIVATLRQFDLPEEEAPGGCDGSCKTDSVHGDRSAPWTK
ncbi:hypothetical protein C2845_PM01G06840 [Panicum miliaceum]|uniref:Uncharacterized protein n=1 Tax=Panicum miliaceum TaxID=4540 RepID=A0A3L6TQI5_PANMI|nr:hypothetical protein C2845_PM01G06840 [Panicum miliaceum]